MTTSIKTLAILGALVAVAGLGILVYLGVFTSGRSETTTKTDSSTRTDVTREEFKIVAFGDSLTAGLGVDLKDSYPSILETILNTDPKYRALNRKFLVINMGVSGETTTAGLERVDFVLAQKPDLILFGLGANDMLRSTNPDLVEKNLTTIVEKLTKSGTPVIILGMQSAASNGFIYKRNFDGIYPTLSKTYNLPLVPFFLAGVALETSLNTADGIHPNRAGYEQIINENLLPILELTIEEII